MIQTNQLRQLARKLRDKTRAKEVNWVPDDDHVDDHGCELLLKNSAVSVAYRSPRAKPDEIVFEVSELTNDGFRLPVGSFSAQEPDERDEDENAHDWSLLHELYLEASKVAFHWDQVLNEVEEAVNSSGRIGVSDENEEGAIPTSPKRITTTGKLL